jgi:hypothetical protein
LTLFNRDKQSFIGIEVVRCGAVGKIDEGREKLKDPAATLCGQRLKG